MGEVKPDLMQEVMALRGLAEFQHEEMIQKLENRFSSLEHLLRSCWPHLSEELPLPRLVPPTFSMPRQASDQSKPESASTQQDSDRSQNYVSFASFDKQLKDCTNNVDAVLSRKKFASSVMKSREGEGKTVVKRGQVIQSIVQHSAFDAFFGVVVIANAFYIGIDLEMDLATNGAPRTVAMQVFLYLFTALFTFELIMRIAAEGQRFFYSEDWHWNYLDIFIVASSLWEFMVDLAYWIGEQTLGTLTGVSSLKAFRIIRITRTIKTVRVIRLFRFLLKLRTLITSIASTLTSLMWAMILLALVIYVFAVLFAQTVNDYLQHPEMMERTMTERERLAAERYFADLPITMLSLFMSIAGGVSWEEVIAPLGAISVIWSSIFLVYFFFTYFAVLNVVTAVFCQTAIDSAQNDHAMMAQSILENKEAHHEKIKTLFSKFSTAEQEGITFAMFEEKISTPAVQEYFATLGLDVWDAWSFFKLLDADAGGCVEINEFLMGCLRFRGQATAVDVGKILQDQEWMIKNQDRFFAILDTEIRDLKMELSAMRFIHMDGPDGAPQGRVLDL